MEIVLHLFICPPNVNFTFKQVQLGKDIKYSLSTLMAVVSLLRLYTLYPRLLLTHYVDDYSHLNERNQRVW